MRAVLFLMVLVTADAWGLDGGKYCGPNYDPRMLTMYGHKNKLALCKALELFAGQVAGKPMTPALAASVMKEVFAPEFTLMNSPSSKPWAKHGLEKYFGTFHGPAPNMFGTMLEGLEGIKMSNYEVEYIGVVTEQRGKVLLVISTYDASPPEGVDVPSLKRAYTAGRFEFNDESQISSMFSVRNTAWDQLVYDAVYHGGNAAADVLSLAEMNGDQGPKGWSESQAAALRALPPPKHYCDPDYEPRHFTKYGWKNKLAVCAATNLMQGKDMLGHPVDPTKWVAKFSSFFAPEGFTFSRWPDSKEFLPYGKEFFGEWHDQNIATFMGHIGIGQSKCVVKITKVKIHDMGVVTELRGKVLIVLSSMDYNVENSGLPKVVEQFQFWRYTFDDDDKITSLQMFGNTLFDEAMYKACPVMNPAEELVQEGSSTVPMAAGYFAAGAIFSGLLMFAYKAFGRKTKQDLLLEGCEEPL